MNGNANAQTRHAARRGRRVRYQVAATLDGFIAGPSGEADWIPHDPDIDFAAHVAQFDTLLVGRRTFEAVLAQGYKSGPIMGKATWVFSRTLTPADHPRVTVVRDKAGEAVARLREATGKDIWLFGGGELFRSLASLGLVDTVEVAVVPVMLGEGIRLLPPPASRVGLSLQDHRVYEKSGIVMLQYAVLRS